jgi:hypothetical protein
MADHDKGIRESLAEHRRLATAAALIFALFGCALVVLREDPHRTFGVPGSGPVPCRCGAGTAEVAPASAPPAPPVTRADDVARVCVE